MFKLQDMLSVIPAKFCADVVKSFTFKNRRQVISVIVAKKMIFLTNMSKVMSKNIRIDVISI